MEEQQNELEKFIATATKEELSLFYSMFSNHRLSVFADNLKKEIDHAKNK